MIACCRTQKSFGACMIRMKVDRTTTQTWYHAEIVQCGALTKADGHETKMGTNGSIEAIISCKRIRIIVHLNTGSCVTKQFLNILHCMSFCFQMFHIDIHIL